MINEKINQPIIDMWKQQFRGKPAVHAPLFFHDFNPKGVDILFIGSNPSFSEDGFRRFLKGTEFEAIGREPEKFFTWKIGESGSIAFCRNIGNIHISSIDQYVDICIAIEDRAKDPDPKVGYGTYFGKFHKISRDNNLSSEFLDLFFCRETTQKELEKSLYPKERLTPFGIDQLKISLNALKKLRPKIIVVGNGFASKILRNREEDSGFNEELGTHEFEIGTERIPIFYSSMLTGQRALDTGSFRRLEWQIGRTLGRPKNGKNPRYQEISEVR